MPRKQTSPAMSSFAAALLAKLPRGGFVRFKDSDGYEVELPVVRLRSLLASLVSQDETKGQAPKKRRGRRG